MNVLATVTLRMICVKRLVQMTIEQTIVSLQ